VSHRGLFNQRANSFAIGRLTTSALLIGTVLTASLVFAAPTAAGALGRATSRETTTSTLWLTDAAAIAKTSNGDSWWLVVSWIDGESESGTASAEVGLENVQTPNTTTFEAHSWEFDVKDSTLSFNDKTGTLDLGSEASPVATLDLTFTTTSSTAEGCTSGSETVYHCSLKGTVSLDTGLTGGGTIAGTFDFDVSTPDIVVDEGCVGPPTSNPCVASLFAESDITTSPAVFASEENLGTTDEDLFGLFNTTAVTSPTGATRTDEVANEENGSSVSVTYKDGVVKMASSGGIVSGSGTISGGTPQTQKSSCTYRGTSYEETSHDDDNADYAGSFTSTPAIGSPLTVKKSTTDALYGVTTVKKI